MSVLRILSWNTQGGGREKIGNIEKYLGDYNILCLQEQGVQGTTGFSKEQTVKIGIHTLICAYAIEQGGSINERCTTSVLVDENIYRYIENVEIMGQIGVRPLLNIRFSDIEIATLHAIANDGESVAQVKAFLHKLITSPRKWILIGDFNSEPERYLDERLAGEEYEGTNAIISKIRFGGTQSRPQGNICWINYSKCSTQGAKGDRDKTLDFACIDSRIPVDKFSFIQNETVLDGYGAVVSDHNLVFLDIDL